MILLQAASPVRRACRRRPRRPWCCEKFKRGLCRDKLPSGFECHSQAVCLGREGDPLVGKKENHPLVLSHVSEDERAITHTPPSASAVVERVVYPPTSPFLPEGLEGLSHNPFLRPPRERPANHEGFSFEEASPLCVLLRLCLAVPRSRRRQAQIAGRGPQRRHCGF